MARDDTPMVLTQQLDGGLTATLPRLPLTAAERRICRGRRHLEDGRAVLLQLPRGAQLIPGTCLSDAKGTPQVVVAAAPEPVVVVTASQPLALLQAAYHLGNRHVALEVHPQQLRLLADSVLEQMLRQRGLQLEKLDAPFCPEGGAYGAAVQHHHA